MAKQVINNAQTANGYKLVGYASGTISSSTPITVTLPDTYKALRIETQAVQNTSGTAGTNLCIIFNGDTGTNYTRDTANRTAGGTTWASITTDSPGIFCHLNNAQYLQSKCVIENLGADGFTGWATGLYNVVNDGADKHRMGQVGWKNSTPITSVGVYRQSGSDTVNVRIFVYGVK